MSLGNRCWWQAAAPRVTGGLLILGGLLTMILSNLLVARFAGWGLVAGLALVVLGALTIAVLARDARMT